MHRPLAPGDRVRVRETFERYGQRFTGGDVLRFEQTWYSRYDDADVYTFRNEAGDQLDWYVYNPRINDLERPDGPEWRERFQHL